MNWEFHGLSDYPHFSCACAYVARSLAVHLVLKAIIAMARRIWGAKRSPSLLPVCYNMSQQYITRSPCQSTSQIGLQRLSKVQQCGPQTSSAAVFKLGRGGLKFVGICLGPDEDLWLWIIVNHCQPSIVFLGIGIHSVNGDRMIDRWGYESLLGKLVTVEFLQCQIGNPFSWVIWIPSCGWFDKDFPDWDITEPHQPGSKTRYDASMKRVFDCTQTSVCVGQTSGTICSGTHR